MKFPKAQIFIFLVSFVITVLLGWILLASNKKEENVYIHQSYDFRKLRLNNSDIDTLKIGNKLELASIKNMQGNALSSFSGEKLFLLVAADPFCPACNFSKDMMKEVRDAAEYLGIPYYPILVSQTRAIFRHGKRAAQSRRQSYFDVFQQRNSSANRKKFNIKLQKSGTNAIVWCLIKLKLKRQ